MKYNLFDLCTPREEIFNGNQKEDVLSIVDLTNGVLNKESALKFFEETYQTEGMKRLFDIAFQRFSKKSATNIIKLTQAMGGGKTHNMIALALLAKYPELRKDILEHYYKYTNEEIEVVVVNGRNDMEYGIWGEIATQLNNKEGLKDYYSPLRAPGANTWEDFLSNTLNGKPLLIIFDELPPYLEKAKQQTIGNSDLSKATTYAITDLLSATSSERLSNVCVVIADLNAAYEEGSNLIKDSISKATKDAMELNKEISRQSENIEPVRANSNDIYHILRKKIFKELPSEDIINDLCKMYINKLQEAQNANITDIDKQYLLNIKESYPFHPCIKELFARFKENQNFQQTRGLIRLMRNIVADLYENNISKEIYLVGPSKMNLNNEQVGGLVKAINPSLIDAISKDIADKGVSVSEIIDGNSDNSLAQEITKLILFSSLANIPNSIKGLSESEIVGYLVEPNKDIQEIKKVINKVRNECLYIGYSELTKRISFQEVENINAKIKKYISLAEEVDAIEKLRVFLKSSFEPKDKDCYQRVDILPALDEVVDVNPEETTLIIFKPNESTVSLPVELEDYYNKHLAYKNRFLFLTSDISGYKSLIESGKKLHACEGVLRELEKTENTSLRSHIKETMNRKHSIELEILQITRDSFVNLYYPVKDGLNREIIRLQFKENKYNAEYQIKELLKSKRKFIDIKDYKNEEEYLDYFVNRIEKRLFSNVKKQQWKDIIRTAATMKEWQLHDCTTLNKVRDKMLKEEKWRDEFGYINIEPSYSTSVFVREISRDKNTGEAILQIIPERGDIVYYEYNDTPNENSPIVSDFECFNTGKNMKINFLCVDSSNKNETGKVYEWNNKIDIKYDTRTLNDGSIEVTLKALPQGQLKYTVDGSNVNSYGQIYDKPFILPKESKAICVVAEYGNIKSNEEIIKINQSEAGKIEIELNKPVREFLYKKKYTSSEIYKNLANLKKHNVIVKSANVGVNGLNDSYVGVYVKGNITGEKIESIIEYVQTSVLEDGTQSITLDISETSFVDGQSFKDYCNDEKIDYKNIDKGDIKQ